MIPAPCARRNQPKPEPRQPQPGEPLFEFVRASDGARIRCGLRMHRGDLFEAQFFEGDFSFYARSGFSTKAAALQWAAVEREAMERGA